MAVDFMVAAVLPEILGCTVSRGHSTDPQRLTHSLVAVPARSADLTTEAWPAAFLPVDDRALVEDFMVGVAFTAVEAAGNWNSYNDGTCR
jgi:hypothetical protein